MQFPETAGLLRVASVRALRSRLGARLRDLLFSPLRRVLFSPEVSPLSTGIPHRPRHSILLRLCPSARSAPTWGQSRTLVGIGLFRPSMSCVIASRALRGPSGIHTSSGHEPPYYCAPRGDLPAQPALKQLHASQVRCPVGCGGTFTGHDKGVRLRRSLGGGISRRHRECSAAFSPKIYTPK